MLQQTVLGVLLAFLIVGDVCEASGEWPLESELEKDISDIAGLETQAKTDGAEGSLWSKRFCNANPWSPWSAVSGCSPQFPKAECETNRGEKTMMRVKKNKCKTQKRKMKGCYLPLGHNCVCPRSMVPGTNGIAPCGCGVDISLQAGFCAQIEKGKDACQKWVETHLKVSERFKKQYQGPKGCKLNGYQTTLQTQCCKGKLLKLHRLRSCASEKLRDMCSTSNSTKCDALGLGKRWTVTPKNHKDFASAVGCASSGLALVQDLPKKQNTGGTARDELNLEAGTGSQVGWNCA
jgi:hypothetical protein